MTAGYEVFAINPMSVASYRERHSTSGAKSDSADAHLLAEIVRLDRADHRPVAGDSDQKEAIKLTARTHQSLVWDRTRHVPRLRSALARRPRRSKGRHSGLTEAASVGDATARALTYRYRRPEAYSSPASAWRSVFLGGYRFQEDGVAPVDAAAQFYFQAGPASPAEEAKIVGAGSQYVVAFVDADGSPFNGSKVYKFHERPNVPAKNFWSVMAYDTQTRSMLETGQDWPSVSSHDTDTDLTTNDDGSIDVYFGPEPPDAGGRNWIQTLPGKGGFAMFRLYGPLEPWFDKTWSLPDIEPVA